MGTAPVCDVGIAGEQQNHLDTHSPKNGDFCLHRKWGGEKKKIIRTLLTIFCVLTFNTEASEAEVSEH